MSQRTFWHILYRGPVKTIGILRRGLYAQQTKKFACFSLCCTLILFCIQINFKYISVSQFLGNLPGCMKIMMTVCKRPALLNTSKCLTRSIMFRCSCYRNFSQIFTQSSVNKLKFSKCMHLMYDNAGNMFEY